MSESLYHFLAYNYPDALAAAISNCEWRVADLTFAAEALGKSTRLRPETIRRTLLPLLEHPSPVVREGAIYGIGEHVNADARKCLQALWQSDDSPGVRQAAEDVLCIDGLRL